MSEAEPSGPAPPEPEPAEPKPSFWERLNGWAVRRQEKVEHNWRFVDAELTRTRLILQVILLHIRYTFGYLSFGFLVSAPLQLAWRDEYGGIWRCLALGAICTLPFVGLWPVTRIDWGRMRIPEFKNMELALTRWATVIAVAFLLLTIGVKAVFTIQSKRAEDPIEQGWLVWLCGDPKVAWLNVGLMFFSWVRVKFHTIMFREFYTLKPEDELVLRVPPSQRKLDLAGFKPGEKAAGEAQAAQAEGVTRAPEPHPARDSDSVDHH